MSSDNTPGGLPMGCQILLIIAIAATVIIAVLVVGAGMEAALESHVVTP